MILSVENTVKLVLEFRLRDVWLCASWVANIIHKCYRLGKYFNSDLRQYFV